MKKVLLLLVILAIGFSSNVFAQNNEGVELTIYNQNFGLVKDRRTFTLQKGTNDIRFTDVAAQIDPVSVHFKSLTDPAGCIIEEQNYEYDLVSADKLLDKYIDKKISVVTKDQKTYEGALQSFDADNIVLSTAAGLAMVCRKDNVSHIGFAELPEGLITKPTLMWRLANNKAGSHLTEVSYLTNGITWNADYVVVTDKDDKMIDLTGWVTINNMSGAAYKDATLKLIAGEVHRAPEPQQKVYAMRADMAVGAAEAQFEEKAFFEYHMYTLQRKTTVKENQTKQISLLTANNVPVKKIFLYDANDYDRYWYFSEDDATKEQKIKVKIEIGNKKENNLGMPLPKGKIKVYKQDADGSLQFIGEDAIDHTPKDEKITLELGDAFDVVGERKRSNYRVDTKGRWAEETFEISLRNHKDSDIEVVVVEHLSRYANWKIDAKSQDFAKKDAQTIEFKVPVAKNGEKKITYTARYWW